MGFLQGLFEHKAAGDSIARATGSSSARFGMMGPAGPWDIDKAVKDGVERVIWVFRCVDAIAQNQAKVPIFFQEGYDADGKRIDDPRLGKVLNVRANSYETAKMFRYRLSAQLLLSRRGAFIEIVKGNDGRPSELHLLPPGMTEPIPHPTKFVEKYMVTRSDFRIDPLEPEQVIWIRLKPHPTDPYAQMTPLVAAGLAAETDYYARLFNRNFLANDGRPGLIVAIKGQLDHQDALEVKRRFSGGPAQAGQTTVIEADGLDFTDLASNPRDVQWLEAIRGSKEDIFLAFGTPESVLGNASGRTFDNADAERENWWMDTVQPHCDGIAAAFDILTPGGLTDSITCKFDYSVIDVLQRQERARHAKLLTEFQAGLITWDEYREGTGKPMWNVPASRVAFLGNGIVIAQNADDQKFVGNLPIIGSPKQAMDPSMSARMGAFQGISEGMRQMANIQAARAYRLANKAIAREHREQKAIAARTESKDDDIVDAEVVSEKVHPYTGLRHRMEGTIEGVLLGWDNRQEDVITDRLMHVKSRKGTRHWDGEQQGEVKALDPKYAVEIDRWASDLKTTMAGALKPIIAREAAAAARDLEATGILDALRKQGKATRSKDPLVAVVGGTMEKRKLVNVALDPLIDIVEKAAKNQSRRVEDTIRKMDGEGATIKQIEKAVRRMIGTRAQWRKTLAVNMTTTGVEAIKAAVYGAAGDLVLKTWNTEGDERVRPTHWAVDGTTVEASKPFTVGGFKMMQPGDPTAPPGEVVNCRCFLDYEPSDKFWDMQDE